MNCGVIRINHDHINGISEALIAAGASLVSFYAPEDDLAAGFVARFPSARRARTEAEVLEDESIQLIATSGIPDERGSLGIRVMRHGKDFMSDKPGFTQLDVLEEARRVQHETGRLYVIDYSERTRNRAQLLMQAGQAARLVVERNDNRKTGTHMPAL